MIFVYVLFIFLFLTLSFSKKNDFLRFGLFNKKGFHELHRMILSYGYNYSIKTHITSTIIFLCVLAFICYEFQIRFESYLIFACILTFILPYIVLWLYFHSYQEKVFNQFTIFLQTFIAVYKINPKTYPALCECEKVCEGEVKNLIIQMKEVLLREGDIEKIIENIVYQQLLRMGYTVHIGQLRAGEVDFVCTKSNERVYVQVAYLIASSETEEREFGSLNRINDNYPKYVISMTPLVKRSDRNGITHIGLREFLIKGL